MNAVAMIQALTLFEPEEPRRAPTFSIETTARLAHVQRRPVTFIATEGLCLAGSKPAGGRPVF